MIVNHAEHEGREKREKCFLDQCVAPPSQLSALRNCVVFSFSPAPHMQRRCSHSGSLLSEREIERTEKKTALFFKDASSDTTFRPSQTCLLFCHCFYCCALHRAAMHQRRQFTKKLFPPGKRMQPTILTQLHTHRWSVCVTPFHHFIFSLSLSFCLVLSLSMLSKLSPVNYKRKRNQERKHENTHTYANGMKETNKRRVHPQRRRSPKEGVGKNNNTRSLHSKKSALHRRLAFLL
jgi:hypothetical protein